MIRGVEIGEIGFEETELAAVLHPEAVEELRNRLSLFLEEPSWGRGGQLVLLQEGVEAAARDADATGKDVAAG